MTKLRTILLKKLDLAGIETYICLNNRSQASIQRMMEMLQVHADKEEGIMDHVCKILSKYGIEYALSVNYLEDDKTTRYWYKRLSREMNERDKFLLEQLQESTDESKS